MIRFFDGSSGFAPMHGVLLLLWVAALPALGGVRDWKLRNPTTLGVDLQECVYGSGLFVGVGDSGAILTSPDTDTWTSWPALTSHWLRGVTYGNGRFVAVGDGGTVLTSATGTNWVVASATVDIPLLSVAYGGGLFVAVGDLGTVLTSSDGLSWIQASSGDTRVLKAVTYGNGTFVAVGLHGIILTSIDGRSWTQQSPPFSEWLFGVAYGDGTYVAVGDNGTIFSSKDARQWQSQSSGTTARLLDVTWGEGIFVGVGENGTLLASWDGQTWAVRESPTVRWVDAVTYGNGLFVALSGTLLTARGAGSWTSHSMGVHGTSWGESINAITWHERFIAVGDAGTILTSTDGRAWQAEGSPAEEVLNGVTHSEDLLVAVGDRGIVLLSYNGSSWSRGSVTTNQLCAVAFGTNRFVAVGHNGTITTAESNGLLWTTRTSGTSGTLRGVAYGAGMFVAVGDSAFLTSKDGIVWKRQTVSLPEDAIAVTYGDGLFVATGWNGMVATSWDGKSWSSCNEVTSQPLRAVAYGDQKYVAVGDFTTIITSPTGRTWQRETGPGNGGWLGAAVFANGTFVAGGSGAIVLSKYVGPVFTVSTSQSGPGTITAEPLDDAYPPGTELTVTASPDFGYRFTGWSGDLSGTNNPAALIVDANKSIATRFVPLPPTITGRPQAQTVVAGSDVTLTVAATSVVPVSYVWMKDGIAIPSTTNSILKLLNVQRGDAGDYAVSVRNAGGSTLSNPAKLTVLSPPVAKNENLITDEDTPLVIALSGSDPDGDLLAFAMLSAPAHGQLTGTQPNLVYRPETNYFGADRFTFTVNDGKLISVPATVSLTVRSVNDAPVLAAIGSQAVDERALLRVALSATDPDGPIDVLTFSVVSGPTGITVSPGAGVLSWTPSAAQAPSTNTVTVKVTDNGSPELSDMKGFMVVVRQLSAPPTIIEPPQSQVAAPGAEVVFRVVAAGTEPLSYQWRFNGNPIPGALVNTLRLNGVRDDQAGYYSVVVTNLAGSATSASAVLTLKAPATLTGVVTDALNGQPLANVIVSAGGRTNLTDLSGRYALTNLTEGVLKADFDADATSGDAPLTMYFVNLSTTLALTLTGEKASYATYRNRQVKVAPDATTELNFSLSAVLTQGMRAVLNWGPAPKDLDLHLQIEGTEHHISYNDRNTPYGRLDHDVTKGWGPEALTVDQFYPGLYHYYVQHYDVFMPGSRLTNSAAQVHLYREAVELRVVSATTTGSGAFWHVCTVDGETGAIRIINQITDTAASPTEGGGDPGGSAGGGGLAGVQFLWDFGDGTTSTNESPVKVYGQAGRYTVILRVDGEKGQRDVQVKPGFVVVGGAGSGARLGAAWVNGRIVLSVSGVVGTTYRIESAASVAAGAVWQTVATLTLSSPMQSWTDDQSGVQRSRYYRAVSP